MNVLMPAACGLFKRQAVPAGPADCRGSADGDRRLPDCAAATHRYSMFSSARERRRRVVRSVARCSSSRGRLFSLFAFGCVPYHLCFVVANAT